jgi:hypothetical protein
MQKVGGREGGFNVRWCEEVEERGFIFRRVTKLPAAFSGVTSIPQ